MALVLCIGDIHLKPKILRQAAELLRAGVAERAVQMGDIVDDWGAYYNTTLYDKTMETVRDFHLEFPDTLWVLGDHDYCYMYPTQLEQCSGHSEPAEELVQNWQKELELIGVTPKVVHKIDECLFSHGGVTYQWATAQIDRYRKNRKISRKQEISLDEAISMLNQATPKILWAEGSPLWVRPQGKTYGMWHPELLQIVGHTPVRTTQQVLRILSVDTHSTYSNGDPYGDNSFAVVDTEKQEWYPVSWDGEEM